MSKNKTNEAVNYELLYIVSNKYSENELTPITDNVAKIIEDKEGKISYKEEWGKKKLAYPIKSNIYGYYFYLEFDVQGEKLKEIDYNLKIFSDVIRYQIVKKPSVKIPKAPRKPERAKSEIKVENQKPKEEKPKTDIEKEKEAKKVDLKDLDEKLDKILDVDSLL